MITTVKAYPKICDYCQGNGFIQPVQGRITTTVWANVCPVCNGAKVIIVTETTYESEPTPVKMESNN
jgi:DnaJ-class molecular chaperone